MIISPIYEDRRSEIEAKELDSGMTLSVILCFFLLLLPFFISFMSDPVPIYEDYEDEGFGLLILLCWFIAPFVGFGNLCGKLKRSNARENFNRQYENIVIKYKEISKKKVNAKDVDKIAKQLETENFSYSEVLDILNYGSSTDPVPKGTYLKFTIDKELYNSSSSKFKSNGTLTAILSKQESGMMMGGQEKSNLWKLITINN